MPRTRDWTTLVLIVLGLVWSGPVPAQTRGIELRAKPPRVSTPFVEGHYRALVVGNADYADPRGQWPALKTALGDARAVARLLREDYGFDDVVLLENASRREMLLAFDELARRVLPNDSVLVYYAGHGWLDSASGRGYWVPVDAAGDDHTTFLRNSTIRDELGLIARRSRHTLLIADSCFSGSLLGGGNRGISARVTDEAYFEKVAARKSVQILAAGGLEYVDDTYGDSGHSPFTYFLLNELRHNGNALMTASELGDNVSRAVANNVDQTPTSGVLQGAGDELGEFIFLNIRVRLPRDGDGPARVDSISVESAPPTAAEPSAPAVDEPAPDTGRPARMLPLPTL